MDILEQAKNAYSFKELDELHGLSKGVAFKVFKTSLDKLVENQDYLYFDHFNFEHEISDFKEKNRIYRSSVNAVFITKNGCNKLDFNSSSSTKNKSS